ncbi:transcription elongation factor SPT6 [Piedraia hortae CBS 480.64]|uniref:Transcription elongation factor Spt6 n=1 Tax=Piedraia hortae CBS 480.64 TaxID=1314780 RepID=A0A6A7C3Q4_9PEZI|nr:transcription elongation factor SPT6 [Piedraia hortae CBS 480.64]
MATMDAFFDRDAEVGSDEEEEEEEEAEIDDGVDGTPRKAKPAKPSLDDSSEEEDDDDEAEMSRIRQGFIVDEEEEEEAQPREERRKRRREDKTEDDELDEEDLDLVNGHVSQEDRDNSKYKRLKRGHRDDGTPDGSRPVDNIFSDDDEGDAGRTRPGYGDDLDDFIEADEFPDEEQGDMDDDLGIRAPKRGGFASIRDLEDSGLGEAELEDMRAAFGEGDEFGWALEVEARLNDETADPDKPLELKDVFDPSQLEDRMLTEEDNIIRLTDVPERFQIARKTYQDLKELGLSEQELQLRHQEEAAWMAKLLFPRKQLAPELRDPFEQAIKKVLEFMNIDEFEPAFIFHNRKDYLIHSEHVPTTPDPSRPDAPAYTIKAEKLLTQNDLWDILDYDLKFRMFCEKRENVQRSVELLKEAAPDFDDPVFDNLLPLATQIEDITDLQDYLNFQYSSYLREINMAKAEAQGTQKRAQGSRVVWEMVRSGPAYHLVRAFGIKPDDLARNLDRSAPHQYTEDPDVRPDDMADTLVQAPDYKTGEEVLNAAKGMFQMEITRSPRIRRYLRKIYYEKLVFDVHRTEKGLKQIDEDHAYYEFKYLRNWEARTFLLERPELFLKMIKAESEGLVQVGVRLQGERQLKEDLHRAVKSDNFSEVADAWNSLRMECVDKAMAKLHDIISQGVKDNIKNECENAIAARCRKAYTDRLDQAPYRALGAELGTPARVLAMSNGAGDRGDATCWVFMDHGRVLESGKLGELRLAVAERQVPDTEDVATLLDIIDRRRPDVIAVSGWSVETRRLYKDVQDIVEVKKVMGNPPENNDADEPPEPLDVIMVNDEVARLYHTSDRAAREYPNLPPVARYAVSLARYVQNPLSEYAALGRDVLSISFDPNQHLIDEVKLIKALETSMVDVVNMVGIPINQAVADPYVANLLPYVSGLGPRKAAHMLKMINAAGGEIFNRNDLVGDPDRNIKQSVAATVFTNCASFLYIDFASGEKEGPEADYLDNTRIHPEDYDLARKIAADALEMDEEDIKVEVDEHGPSAVVRRLVNEEHQDKVDDLVLEQYAEQLEKQMKQLKRATLETIRVELQGPYEEIRDDFHFLTTDEMFTMLTGETQDSLVEGLKVPVVVKRIFVDHLEVRLDCGIDGTITSEFFPDELTRLGIDARQRWQPHQVIQAKVLFIDRKKLSAQLSIREADLSIPYKRHFDHGIDEWDAQLELRDKKEANTYIDPGTGKAQRVIKHTYFRPFNSAQAIEFLGPQPRGSYVIRPSSKGPDHLAVTWKVHEGIYQHIDVLELDKENEFSVGRVLRIGGKYSYSDLDELIANHVGLMAKKVEEMINDERFQQGSRQQTGKLMSSFWGWGKRVGI